MRYFLEKNRSAVVRVAVGVLLCMVILALSIFVIPMFTPSGMGNVIPIVLFGAVAMYFTAGVVITNDEKPLVRVGMTAMAAALAFVAGAVIGGSVGMDNGVPAYGWFLGVVCAILAAAGGAIGFVIPNEDGLKDLKISWDVARRHF